MSNRELANQCYDILNSLNIFTKYNVSLIRGEDKKFEIGQIAITLVSKARELIKLKKMSIRELKIIGLDEADYFFKTEIDTNHLTALLEQITKEAPNC
jgi:uncharacterized protein YjiS (DUF1127 family)